MYHVAICDDSEADRLALKKLLIKNDVYVKEVILHEYESGNQLIEAMKTIQFSLIFLDMRMDGMSGRETACRIRERDSKVVLVFITGSVEPASDVFRVTPYRYMIKTAAEEELDTDIKSIIAQMISTESIPRIKAAVDKQIIRIHPNDILYIEKYERKSRVHITQSAIMEYRLEKKGDVLSGMKLADIYECLKGYGFGWPHDSYIINFKYVNTLAKDYLLLEGVPAKFTITRSKTKEFGKQKSYFLLGKYNGGK